MTVLGRFPATSGAVDEGDWYQVKSSAGTGYINSHELTSSELMEEGEEMATIAQIGPQAPAKEQLDTKEAGQQLVALDPSGKGIEAYSRPPTDFSERSFIKNGEQVTLIGTVDAAAQDPRYGIPMELKPGEWSKVKTSAGESYVLSSKLTTPDKFSAYQEKQEEIQKADAARAQQAQKELTENLAQQRALYDARVATIKQLVQNPGQADQETYQAGYRQGEIWALEKGSEGAFESYVYSTAIGKAAFHTGYSQHEKDSWAAGFVKACRENN